MKRRDSVVTVELVGDVFSGQASRWTVGLQPLRTTRQLDGSHGWSMFEGS